MAESTTASANIVDSTSDVADAVNHLVQGKRHLLVQDYVSAVSSLQEACQLFAQKYGEAANECGEPYLFYGKALLELARIETGVLGNALEGVPAEEDSDSDEDGQVESPDNITEEEREKIKQDVDDAIDENSRDLEEKFQQLKEKSDSETAIPVANEDKMAADKLGDVVKEENLPHFSDKFRDETVAAAEQNKTLEISDNLDETVKAEGTSANVKSNDDADNTASKKEIENKDLAEKTVQVKEDIEKAFELVGVADSAEVMENEAKKIVASGTEKKEVIDDEKVVPVIENESESNDVKAIQPGMSDVTGRKTGHEKIVSATDTVGLVETKDIETVEDIKESKGDDAKDEVGDFADKDRRKKEIAKAAEKVELENDLEVKEKVFINKEQPKDTTVKSEASEEVEEGVKDSVQIDATNDGEKMETEESVKSDSVNKKNFNDLSVDAPEQQEKFADATHGTSNGVTEPTSAQDESMEADDDAVEENTSNLDEANDESEAGPSGSNEEKEDEVTNLQLAWEVLEIAKIIFKRKSETDKTMELKTAEVLLKLGEISIESENYKQAIEDLNECLRLQKHHLTPDDRAIAETYYQLGLANSFYGQYEESIESFQKSMQVIEERIATLQQCTTDSADKNVDIGLEDTVEAAKREIEDLQGVLPDIKSKIEDTEDLMKNSEVALKEAALQRLQENASTAIVETDRKEQDISKPTNNITHLLKRKRKSEGNVDTTVDIDAKKHRSASGDHCANGRSVANGDPTLMKADGLQNVESTPS